MNTFQFVTEHHDENNLLMVMDEDIDLGDEYKSYLDELECGYDES